MKGLAVALKLAFILALVATFYLHLWSMWTVTIWAIVTGILFTLVDRYNWFLTKAGCDLFGSGVLLLALSLVTKFTPSEQVHWYGGVVMCFFSAYFAIIGLYHITQIAKNAPYKYPIVWIVGEPLFKYTYLGIENVKGE